MPLFHPKTLLDKSYEIGIILKGLNGTFELIGGMLVLTLSPSTITGITKFLTESALENNPHNFIASHIAHAGASLAAGHNVFAAAFLLTHGVIKVVLVTFLLLDKHWVFPYAIGALGLFMVYQIYQLIVSPGIGMVLLTIIDAVIVWLIWREWQNVRRQKPKPAD